MLKKVLSMSLLLFIAGCVSVPRETVALSEELGEMIKTSEATHLALVDEYALERKTRVDQFLRERWLPDFMTEFAVGAKLEEKLAEKQTAEERTLLISQFSEAAVSELAKRQKAMYGAVDAVGDTLRGRVREHYNNMRLTNESLTIYLRTASKVSKTRDDLLKRMNIPAKDVVPLNEINKSMEQIVSYKGKIEDMQKLVDETKAILAGGVKQ